MKKFLKVFALSLIFFLGSMATAQAAPFLATFRTTSASESITLPLITGYAYNFTVDWGDGTTTSDITTFDDVDRVHTYVIAGDYQISVTGTMPMWNFNAVNASKDNIISLDDAGDVGFGTGVLDMSYMFYATSNLTTVALFDTSSATTMSRMFQEASALTTVPLFDTSSVMTMYRMFQNASALTTVPLFNTSSVSDMSLMFFGASSLTSIPLLDTSAGEDFQLMFYGASNLTTIPLLNTGLGTNFYSMFNGASSLTSIPLIDTSSGTNFSAMFNLATSLTTVPLLDVSAGLNLDGMFNGTSSLTTGALSGAQYNISYKYANMDTSALQDVFSGLGIAAGTQTIDIIGNPGQPALVPADCAIATGKGWIVVPECTGTGEIPDKFCTSGDIATLNNPIADSIYWDWDGNSPYLANSGGTAVVVIIAPSETVKATTAELPAAGTAEPGMVYFDEETGELYISDATGTLQDPATITSNAVADTAAVEASAVVGEVYFNTTTGEVFYCEVDGVLDTPADPSSSCLTQ